MDWKLKKQEIKNGVLADTTITNVLIIIFYQVWFNSV